MLWSAPRRLWIHVAKRSGGSLVMCRTHRVICYITCSSRNYPYPPQRNLSPRPPPPQKYHFLEVIQGKKSVFWIPPPPPPPPPILFHRLTFPLPSVGGTGLDKTKILTWPSGNLYSTSVSRLVCSCFELAPSSLNSGTHQENFHLSLPIGQVTAEICLPVKIY